jgi:hypothetical protein
VDEVEREYAALAARGARPREEALHPDLVSALRQFYAQFARVESWALGMQAHLLHLERRIAELEGRPPAELPDATGAAQRAADEGAPLVLVLDRRSALGRAALLAKRLKRRWRAR